MTKSLREAVSDQRANVTLDALQQADFAEIIALARSIWLAHYVPIIGKAQVEYMLAERFTAKNLRRYLDSQDRWLEVLRVNGTAVGFLSYTLTETADELKLEQLYLAPELHGIGLGSRMLRHAERRALELGCALMMLTVNKRNAGSIAMYLKSGFTVRNEAVFDIGQGFVMDDYVMEKRLD